MKLSKHVLTLAVLLMSASAFARPDTANMTCSQAAALVESSGAIVLSTGSQDIYDRYVSYGTACDLGLQQVPAWVPTRDNSECFIGFTCSAISHH